MPKSRVRINLTGKTPKTPEPAPKKATQSPTSRVRINLTVTETDAND